MDVGMVCPDRKGEAFEHHGLPYTGGSHDEAALTHTERGNEIDGPCRRVIFTRLLQVDSSVREHGGQLLKLSRDLPILHWNSLDREKGVEPQVTVSNHPYRSPEPQAWP